MSTSWAYRHPVVYEIAMMGLYGRHYSSRFQSVSAMIPDGASVVDLCCGPGTVYSRYLRQKKVKYLGIDVNPVFIENLKAEGAGAEIRDLHADVPLPTADYVMMLGGLLHFLPDPRPMVDRMLAAATKKVIILDPIRNMATSSNPLVRWIGVRSTNPGTGPAAQRFDEAGLDRFFGHYRDRVEQSFRIPGGRDKVYVLQGNGQPVSTR